MSDLIGRLKAKRRSYADCGHTVMPELLQEAISALEAVPSTQAAVDVMAERQRQIEKEGWTALHDDSHEDSFALSKAAACYARYASDGYFKPVEWPWSLEWWKPKSQRRDLVRAAALILAEIERLDRLPAPPIVEQGD